MASLSSATPILLKLLHPWLDGLALIRLYLSGCPIIRRNLSLPGVVTELRFESYSRMATYPRLSTLPFGQELRILRLSNHKPSLAYWKLDELPSTLEILDLAAVDASTIFAVPHSPDVLVDGLSERFPRLTHLSLHDNTPNTWIGHDMNKLPSTLESLQLNRLAFGADFNISALTSLTSFSVRGYVENKDNILAKMPMKFTVFPPSLVELHLDADRVMFEKILANAHSKDATTSTTHSDSDASNKLLEALPQLRSLKLAGLSSTATHTLLTMLPPHLISLSLLMSGLSYLNVALLPQKLTHLTIVSHSLDGESLQHLPRTLTHLSIRKPYSTDNFADLPPQLITLNIGVSKITSVSLGTLPRSILYLSLHLRVDISEADLALLPPNLISLSINPCKSIPSDSLQILPSTLRSLSLDSLPFASEALLQSLPQKLTSLELPNTQRIESIEVLPPGLKHFYATMLTSITADDIPKLPKSLLTLVIPLVTSIPSSSMTDLPPDLRDLCLNGSSLLPRSEFYRAFLF